MAGWGIGGEVVGDSPAAPESPGLPEYSLESFLGQVAGNTEHPHLLMLYSPGCPHCIKFKPIFRELQGALLDKAGVAAGEVDCSKATGLCRMLKVNAFPTLLFFSQGKVYKFTQKRNEEEILKFVTGGFAGAEGRPIPTELPTGLQELADTLDEFKEEILYIFYESDSWLLKTIFVTVAFVSLAMLLFCCYLMTMCAWLVCRKQPEHLPKKKD